MHSPAPVTEVGREAVFCLLFHILRIEGEQSAIELSGPLSTAVTPQHVAEQCIVAADVIIACHIAALPEVPPPLLRTFPVVSHAHTSLRHRQFAHPVVHGTLLRRHHNLQVATLCGFLSDVHPPVIVARSVVTVHTVHEHEATSRHSSTEDQILQRVGQSGFHGLHLLLLHSGIEDGLLTILMEESDTLFLGDDAVAAGFQAFGSCKLITGLKGCPFRHLHVTRAPALIISSHHHLLALALYIHVDYRFEHIGPQAHGDASVCHLDVALIQMQYLPEMLHVKSR